MRLVPIEEHQASDVVEPTNINTMKLVPVDNIERKPTRLIPVEKNEVQAPIEADKEYRQRFDPTIERDVAGELHKEPIRKQLDDEFSWLNAPPKIKDEYAKQTLEQMVGLWHSNIEPERKLELLRKWQKGAARFAGSETSLLEAEREALPGVREQVFREETVVGDTLRTLAGAGTEITGMVNAAIKGIADITPFMPESVRGWLKENESDIAEQSALIMDEISNQGGMPALVAQRVGQEALTTALRLLVMRKLPSTQIKNRLYSALRFGMITAITTPGSVEDRAKAAGRAVILMSTPIGAKGVTSLLKITGRALPYARFAVDAGLNVGLGYLFNSSRYDFSQPDVVIPTLITDVLFAADTGIDAAKELTEKARLEKIKADATYVKEQYIAQEGKKAEEAFKKAEATKEQRITESDVKKSREQMTAELQEEINKLLPPEPPTRVEVPKPEQQKTPLLLEEADKLSARQTSERMEPETRPQREESRPEATKMIGERLPDETVKPEPPTRIELPKTPMPEQRESKVKRIVDNAEKNKTDNVIQASKDIIKAEIEIAKPYDKKTLQNTSTDRLVKMAKDMDIDTDTMERKPTKEELVREIIIKDKRLRQEEVDGIVKPLSPLSKEYQSRIRNALGIKKPLTPEQRQKKIVEFATAEGIAIGKSMGVKEGMLTQKKAMQQALREKTKTAKVYRKDLQRMANALPKEDAKNMLAKINLVNNFKDYEKIANQIAERAGTVERRDALKSIHGDIQAFRQGRVTPAIREAMTEEIASKIGLSAQFNTVKSAQKNVDDIVRRFDIKDISNPKELSKELERVAKDMSPDTLAELRDNLAILKAASDKTVKAQLEQDEAIRVSNVKESVDIVSKAAPLRLLFLGKERPNETQAARSLPRKTIGKATEILRLAIPNIYSKVKILDAGKSGNIHQKILIDNFRQGTMKAAEIKVRGDDIFNEISSIMPQKWSMKPVEIMVHDKATGKPTKIKMTQDERLSLFLTASDPKGQIGLAENGIDKGRYVLDAGDISKLQDSMGERELAIATLTRRLLDQNLSDVKNTYLKLNKFDMPGLRDNYWRTFAEKDLIREPNKSGHFNVEDVGWLKPKKGGRPLKIAPYTHVLKQLINETANYVGYADALRQAKGMLNDTAWQKSVSDKFGQSFVENIAEHIKNVESKPFVGNIVDRFFTRRLNNISSSYVKMNLGTILKQPMSSINMIQCNVPVKYALKHMFDMYSIKELGKIPYLRRRFSENTFEREIAEEFNSLTKAEKTAGQGLKFGDQKGISPIYGAVREWLTKESGLTGKALDDAIADKVVDITMRTQPTSDIMNQTSLQQMPGALARVTTLFSSYRSKLINEMLLSPAIELANAKTPNEIKEASSSLDSGIILLAIAAGCDATINELRKRGRIQLIQGVGELSQQVKAKMAGVEIPESEKIGKIVSPTDIKNDISIGMIKSLVGLVPLGREAWEIGSTMTHASRFGTRQAISMGRLEGALESGLKDIGVGFFGIFDDKLDAVQKIEAAALALDRWRGGGWSIPLKDITDVAKTIITPEYARKYQDWNFADKLNQFKTGKTNWDDVMEYIKFMQLPTKQYDEYVKKLEKARKDKAKNETAE